MVTLRGMSLRVPRLAVLVSSLSLFIACRESAEPQPIDSTASLPEWDVGIEPEDIEDGLEVCVDGLDAQPGSSFVVRNTTQHTFPITFTPTGMRLALMPEIPGRDDTTLPNGRVRRMFMPGQTATVEVELLDPFGASPRVAIELPLEPPPGSHFVDVFPIVDVRALDVTVGPITDGKPTIVVRNPFPFRAAITFASEGKWRAPAERRGVDSRGLVAIALESTNAPPVSATVAAKITIDGDRCTKGSLPEHGAIEIP